MCGVRRVIDSIKGYAAILRSLSRPFRDSNWNARPNAEQSRLSELLGTEW